MLHLLNDYVHGGHLQESTQIRLRREEREYPTSPVRPFHPPWQTVGGEKFYPRRFSKPGATIPFVPRKGEDDNVDYYCNRLVFRAFRTKPFYIVYIYVFQH